MTQTRTPIISLNGHALADSEARGRIDTLSADIEAIRAEREAEKYGLETGAVIRLSDAAALPPRELTLFGRSTQSAVPTESAPVAPVSIGDDGIVQIRFRGKNLVNVAETVLTAGVSHELPVYLALGNGVQPGHTYTLSLKVAKSNVVTSKVSVRVYDGSNSQIAISTQQVLGDGSMKCTFTVGDAGIRSIYITLTNRTDGDTVTISDVQLEKGVAVTPWASYDAGHDFYVHLTGGLRGIPVTAGGNYTDDAGRMWLCDTADFTAGVITRRTGVIESYAGEAVTGAYMSSTGGLTAGAKIIHALPEPLQEPMSDEDVTIYGGVCLRSPDCTLYNLSQADMRAGYERVTAVQESSGSTPFDPTHYGMPVLYLSGDTSAMTKDNAVTLSWQYRDMSGRCTCKWQGSSSLWLDKKNYTIAFDRAFEAREGWGAQKKYCFKANFVDHSHARNICSARLWGQLVKSRENVPARFADLINAGAIDGFPVCILLNGEFHGLYTWNIPKEGWMMGFDGTETRGAILCADETDSEATGFFGPASVVDREFSLEYATDEADTDWIITSLNRLIAACADSDGTDLDTTLAQYIDWESAIDSYIFTVLISGADNVRRNYLLVTEDGVKWYFSQYDMDETFGQYLSGTKLKADFGPTFESNAARHRVYELIRLYKKDALKARYAQLRAGIMSEINVCQTFGNFIGSIPSHAFLADSEKWPTIPMTSVSDFAQICHYYGMLVRQADHWIEQL
ncbi:MAG: hypothetical protein E7337_10990 [Clostridiales bacterium]|nr:hypothetical protein [Clostridiales bacterium]